jgi:DNA-binding beta-propeller fold protein YncE
MHIHKIFLTLFFAFYVVISSCQLFYSSYNSIFSYDAATSDENLIVFTGGSSDFSQLCINPQTKELYLSGFGTNIYDFEGRQLFNPNIDYDISSSQSNSMALDVRNNVIYSTRAGRLEAHSIGNDWTQSETIVNGSDIHGIAIDTINDKIYYSDRGTNRIYTVNFDGSENEEVVYLPSGLADPRGLALDLQRGKMYWANTGQKKIQRANLDGSEIENVVLGFDSPENLSFNIEENIIYITDIEMGALFSYSIDSEVLDTLYINESSLPSTLEYNSDSGYLFWIDEFKNSGHRINVATKENQSIFVSLDYEVTFAVDELQGLIFVGSDNGIFKFNLDGSFGTRISNYAPAYDSNIAIDILEEDVYFINQSSSVYKIDYKGTSDTMVYTNGYFSDIRNLEFDGLNNVMYWLEDGDIYKFNSGLSKELFFDFTEGISLFTLDYINSKIYFKSGSLVYISNFDGSNTEPIIGSTVYHMVVDPSMERLFYSNNEGIFTSELNGYYEEPYLESGAVNEFTFGSTDGYLIIPTISTDAEATQDAITLTWEVSSDFNGFIPSNVVLGDFEIEKRNVFGQFENIGFVEYVLGETNYSFEDEDPIEGENEYRLKYISDINGLTSYSKYFSTEFVISSADEIGVDDKLFYSFQDQKFINSGISGSLSIYNLNGQVIKNVDFHASTNQIEMNDLKRGIYIYSLNEEIDGNRKGRFIKM